MRTAKSIAVGVLALGLLAITGHADTKLSPADKRSLAELALQWAVDGGIPDFKLVKDPANLVVSNANLDKLQVKLTDHKVTILPPRNIQARADKEGDFLYFRFGRFGGDADRATVAIALVWAVGKDSEAQYLSGGGATLKFEKRDDKWQMLPVTNKWMS